MRLFQNRLVGIAVLAVGFMILLSLSNNFLPGLLIIFVIGVLLLKKHYRKMGYFFLILAVLFLLDKLLHFNLVWTFLSVFLIYYGYRMFKEDEKPFTQRKDQRRPFFAQTGQGRTEHAQYKIPFFLSSVIGHLYLIDRRYEFNDINVSYGICDVKIDLSKAIIPEGVNSIVISGLIGNVDIYVPDDLDVSIAATVGAGYLDVPGLKQGGAGRQVQLTTKGYEQSRRKMKISVSLLFGDIGVRVL
ncbi:MAG: cell wall-active antibiotics response protein LiaF [Thermoactinomyces sp.]